MRSLFLYRFPFRSLFLFPFRPIPDSTFRLFRSHGELRLHSASLYSQTPIKRPSTSGRPRGGARAPGPPPYLRVWMTNPPLPPSLSEGLGPPLLLIPSPGLESRLITFNLISCPLLVNTCKLSVKSYREKNSVNFEVGPLFK